MKKLFLFIFISNTSFAQIQVSGDVDNGAILISPKGIQGKYNRSPGGWPLSSNISLGTYALDKNSNGVANIGIGNHTLQNLISNNSGYNGNGNVAIGHLSMQNSVNAGYNIAIGMHALLNAEGILNIGIGTYALLKNTTGTKNNGIGESALTNNTSGSYNTGIGSWALGFNTTGNHNLGIGYQALMVNELADYNIGIGPSTLAANYIGTENIAIGHSSLYSNTSGNVNIATGHESLHKNTSGGYNIAVGRRSLNFNESGSFNTAIGNEAGANSIGSYNTFIGDHSNVPFSSGFYSNATAIGYNAIVDDNNKVRIGNSAVSVIEGQVPWSNPSDRRLKENIQYTSSLGLNFITRLKTVSYNYISDENKTRHDGFIAQDVESVMKELNIQFSGLKKSTTGTYSLAYSDFVMPLANAVKEQQEKIEFLEKQNQRLLSSIEDIKAELLQMKKEVKKTESE